MKSLEKQNDKIQTRTITTTNNKTVNGEHSITGKWERIVNVYFHRNLNVSDWTDCNKFPPNPLFLLFIMLFLIWRLTLTFGLLHLAICQPFDRKHILTSHLIPFWSVLHDTSNQRAFDSPGQRGEWKFTFFFSQHSIAIVPWAGCNPGFIFPFLFFCDIINPDIRQNKNKIRQVLLLCEYQRNKSFYLLLTSGGGHKKPSCINIE